MDEEYIKGKYYDVKYFGYDFVGCILKEKKDSQLIFQEIETRAKQEFQIPRTPGKIRLFRTKTMGREEIYSYTHSWIRKFDKSYHLKIAQRLRQFLDHHYSTFSPTEIIQFLRGENFWHFSRIFSFLLSSEEQGTLLTNCIKAYLPFIIKYITEFEEVETDDIYENSKVAYMSAYREILINVQQLLNVRGKDTFYRDNQKFLNKEFFDSLSVEWLENQLIPTITARNLENLSYDVLFKLTKMLNISMKVRRQQPTIFLMRDIFKRILTLASMGQGTREFFNRNVYVEPILNYIKEVEKNVDEYRLLSRLGSLRLRDFQKDVSFSCQIIQDCRQVLSFVNERFRDKIRSWFRESGIIKRICKYRGKYNNVLESFKQIIKKDSLYQRPEQKSELYKFFLKEIEFETQDVFQFYQFIMVEANILEKNMSCFSQQVSGTVREQTYKISRQIFGLQKVFEFFKKNTHFTPLEKSILNFLCRLHLHISVPELEMKMLKALVEWVIENIAFPETVELSQKQQILIRGLVDCLMLIYDKKERLKNNIFQWVSPHLGIIFHRLPETEKLWDCLNITLSMWDKNESLIQIKKLFLEHYLLEQESDLDKLQKWNATIRSEQKKQIVLDIFKRERPSNNIAMLEWLKEQPSELNSEIGITNNLKIIEIFRKWKLPVDSTMISLVFQLMKLNEGYSSDEGEEEALDKNENYQKLLEIAKSYILQKSELDLFKYFLQVDEDELSQLQSSYKLGKLINGLWKNSFIQYEIEEKQEILLVNFPQNIENCIKNFQRFIKLFQSIQTSSNEDKLYREVLNNCINYLTKKQNIQFHLSKVLLDLVVALLNKNYKTPSFYQKQFANFISKKLYSNFTSSVLKILGKLLKEKTIATMYIEFFQKDLNEPSWFEKETIKVTSKKFVKGPTGYVGLRNPHSICYMNSFLQQIFHIPEFRTSIYQTKWKENQNREEDLVLQLKKTFLNLERNQTDAYINRQFISSFKDEEGKDTRIDVQMDVDEFRNILFDRVENLIISPDDKQKNFIRKLFVGKQATFIRSKECKHQSKKQEDFSSICVEVKGYKNLRTSLDHYFQTETLEGENRYFCQDCKKKVKAQKTLRILQSPPYLTFVLKRFDFLFHYRQKINSKFQFPFNNFQFAAGIKYNLKGIIIHQGLSEAGHYFSLIHLNQKWLQFNDSFIEEVKESDVQKYGFGEEYKYSNKNAYLLIYEKEGNEKKRIQNGQKQIRYEGLKKEFEQINRSNHLNKKMHIFFNQHFENLVIQICKYSHHKSFDLLLQYILTIKSKISSTQKSCEEYDKLFHFYQEGSKTQIPKNQNQRKYIINFYRNSAVHVSIKILFTETLVQLYSEFNTYMKDLVKDCLYFLYDEFSETAHYYHLFLQLGKKDKQVLHFLIEGCLLGRIMELSLGSIISEDFLKSMRQICDNKYFFGPITKSLKKKEYEKELHFYKWKLINFILESGISINKIQQEIILNCSEAKYKRIFEDCVNKPNINEVSKMFCILAKKNAPFGLYYCKLIEQKLSNDKSDQLRKYLKAAKDLMKVDDSEKREWIAMITKGLIKAIIYLENQKLMSSLDIVEQWVLKIAQKNKAFRRELQQHEAQLMKIFANSTQKHGLTYRTDIVYPKSDEKLKNRYHGLVFPSNMSQNSQHLADKKSRMIQLLKTSGQIHANEWDSDADLIDTKIKKNTKLMKFDEKSKKFQKIRVDEVSGILIKIAGKHYWRYDDCLTRQFDGEASSNQTEHDQ